MMLYLKKHSNKIKKLMKISFFSIASYYIIVKNCSTIHKDDLINIIILLSILYIILENYYQTY